MTTFPIDDGTLRACETVEQIIDWLGLHSSYVDHHARMASFDHLRDALRQAYALGRRDASTEAPRG
ncbi:hypothetical protein HYPGJ_31455 [Hyphomicrobium sp. GJ21]|uniref:hypothetical protein n=1 Tax=Hyphomicrobium sp. GJ21 TaxID=113574 RepID=UPI000622BA41|nr:hypothetical protein [Hyphomicrobium sp. GJ21]CEJ87903.1 hypothetical protein HYPGJ_31455 [Hyphomicrobium sp. GJ21]